MPRYLADILGTVPPPVDRVPSPETPEPCASVLLDFHAPASARLVAGDTVDVTVRVVIRAALPG